MNDKRPDVAKVTDPSVIRLIKKLVPNLKMKVRGKKKEINLKRVFTKVFSSQKK